MDRESVMQALKDSLRNQHCGFIEGVGNVYAVSEETINDTLELLKEQEAKPMIENEIGWNCPSCGMNLIGKSASGYPCDLIDLPEDEPIHFCPRCGRSVKWE